MKSNKNVLLLIGAFILLGINLGMVNWKSFASEQNLAAGFGIIISLLIISLQFKKIKKQN
ncbi:hypothetical protein [Aequorivita sp. KMM 9714]|uniref:hypothetical protein n=1 Tax=Aequorivita sp. KMM 9714 TaxID=2707173 RepID=UPI0013EC4BDF|nr:hypothetical protein [Aequorivita sp. KMM 9714]NGX84620.1 hypothetical protein [Aequorivita sp. KMM 9714]